MIEPVLTPAELASARMAEVFWYVRHSNRRRWPLIAVLAII